MTRRLDWEKAARRDLARETRRSRPVKTNRRGDLPATPKQLGYLKGLGVTPPARLTRVQAGALIDAKKAAKR